MYVLKVVGIIFIALTITFARKLMMKKFFSLAISFQTLAIALTAQVQLTNPRLENLTNPLGIDVLQPQFSWELLSNKRNVLQSAYEIKVFKGKETVSSPVWSTGKVSSSESVHVPYAGPALQSGEKYYWQVRVWDNVRKVSAWSQLAFWQMGLLSPADWKAKWIEAGYTEDSIMRPSPAFRKQFSTNKKIRAATAFITWSCRGHKS